MGGILASRKRDSDSSTPINSSGRPKRPIKSAARSRANFFASPRMEPWERRSNSGRLLGEGQRGGNGEGNPDRPLEKGELLVGVRLGQPGLVYPGIAHHGALRHSCRAQDSPGSHNNLSAPSEVSFVLTFNQRIILSS